jgi:hypothetical protein
MLTERDIEAEYVDVLASVSPRQMWAIQLYAAACALVAAERGAAAADVADQQKRAREALFRAEAARRNAEAQARAAAAARRPSA